MLEPERLSDVLFFNIDGNWRIVHTGETSEFAGGKWSLVGKVLIIGDQVYNLTQLSDSFLRYDIGDQFNDDEILKFFYEKAK